MGDRHRSNPKNAKTASDNNPCLQEQNLSFKCMNEYNYDSDKCQLYFDNYNNCKEFWTKVQRIRRNKGIQPYLPDTEERANIKERYLATGKID